MVHKMQAESEQKKTDGERLFNLREIHHMSWSDISKQLCISRSMCHAVMRNDKRLGRDSLERLDALERQLETSGSQMRPQSVNNQSEPAVSITLEALRAENATLKAELAKALDTISNLSKALASINTNRPNGGSPTAAHASGASDGGSRHKTA